MRFIGHINYPKGLSTKDDPPSHPHFTSRSVETPQTWFQSDATKDSKSLSLTLATALLEYSPVDLVVDTAKGIEAALGAHSEEELDDIREVFF